MVAKGDAIKHETRQEQEGNPREPKASPKKRKTGEPDVNPGGASSLTADTPRREESGTMLTGCIAAVIKMLCDLPPADLSHDRIAQTGKFPEDAMKAGRKLVLRNMLHFDAFECMEELPAGKHTFDMVWVDEWRGDRVRSRLCLRQFRAEDSWTTCLLEHQTRSSSNIS